MEILLTTGKIRKEKIMAEPTKAQERTMNKLREGLVVNIIYKHIASVRLDGDKNSIGVDIDSKGKIINATILDS